MRDILKFFLFILILKTHCAEALDLFSEIEDNRDVHSAELWKAFSSPNHHIRKRVSTACGRIQKPECISPLISLLKDKEESVISETLFALGQYGWNPSFSQGREPEISLEVAPFLSHHKKLLRIRAIEAIGKIALQKAPELLEKTLQDSDTEILNETLLALYRYRLVLRLRGENTIPDLSEDYIKRLIELSQKKQTEPYVAFWLSKIRDLRAFDALLSLSQSENPITRLYAISAFSKYPEKSNEFISNLKENFYNKHSQIRIAALQSALSLKLSDIVPSLKNDPSISVRSLYTQTLSLSNLSNDSKEKILMELYENKALSVKAEALKALVLIVTERAALNLIHENLNSENWFLRNAAAQSSVSLSIPEQTRIIKKALVDTDVRVRTTALELFATQATPESYLAIQEALQSNELSERGTAVTLLAETKESNKETLIFNCYQNSSGEKWIELREELTKTLSTIMSDQSTEMLKTIVKDPSLSVYNIAAQALKDRQIQETFLPPEEQFSKSPYLNLKFSKNPLVFLKTNKGEITLELFAKDAPIHTANLYGFVKDKKYDGLPVHRVVYNFVVQGGDPDKTGWGSAGYSLRAEINKKRYLYGTLGMPRSTGFDTGGVQFFITHIPTPHLDGQYTVFGRVTKGMDVVNSLEVGDLIEKAWVH